MDWKQKYEPIFQDVVFKKYRVMPDFRTIEKKVAHLRDGDPITYEDLEAIAREDLWRFDKYWRWPAREQIEDDLAKTADLIIDPVARAEDEPDMIHNLLALFKNICLMSVLLRFVWPEHYAIYTRPNLLILHIDRGYDDTEEYLNYVREMRTLRVCFGLERTADVDMIVWAISQSGEGFDDLKRLIDERLPKELPLAELLKHSGSNPLRIADAFFAAGDDQTAGFWASRAFEKILHKECRRRFGYIPRSPEHEIGDIEFLIRCVGAERHDEALQDLMLKMKKLRNATIHVNRAFNSQMAAEFIKGVKAVAEKLDLSC
jgi:hypothetical protein